MLQLYRDFGEKGNFSGDPDKFFHPPKTYQAEWIVRQNVETKLVCFDVSSCSIACSAVMTLIKQSTVVVIIKVIFSTLHNSRNRLKVNYTIV